MALYKPTPEELAEILAKHKRWLEESKGWSEDDKADLTRANLAGANLAGADLSWADLTRANLAGANLTRANLAGANLTRAKNGELALAMTEIVPREGSFVGWKKCCDDVLVKLRIPEDAKRSNAFGRKCRASKVEVLEITKDGEPVEVAVSTHDKSFTYHVGDVLEVPDFDEDRMHECAPGIHFYLTPEEAKAHV